MSTAIVFGSAVLVIVFVVTHPPFRKVRDEVNARPSKKGTRASRARVSAGALIYMAGRTQNMEEVDAFYSRLMSRVERGDFGEAITVQQVEQARTDVELMRLILDKLSAILKGS